MELPTVINSWIKDYHRNLQCSFAKSYELGRDLKSCIYLLYEDKLNFGRIEVYDHHVRIVLPKASNHNPRTAYTDQTFQAADPDFFDNIKSLLNSELKFCEKKFKQYQKILKWLRSKYGQYDWALTNDIASSALGVSVTIRNDLSKFYISINGRYFWNSDDNNVVATSKTLYQDLRKLIEKQIRKKRR